MYYSVDLFGTTANSAFFLLNDSNSYK